MGLKQLIVIGAASAALLTGCAGSGSDDASIGGVEYSDSNAGMAAADEAAARASDGELSAQDVGSPSDYLVREASLGIKVDSIADAALRVREIAVGAGGSVVSEQFGDSIYGPASTDINRYGTMTIRVPSERLDATMTELTELGEVRTRSSNAYDVQDEYVDVEARIATLEASIERMRTLMEQTEDIEQIVALETALSSRQADLDSLQARLNSLSSRIAQSPITVMLTTTDDLGEPDGGIIGALKDAWEAFKTSAALLITAVGALLPWLVVGALGIWVLVALLRRLDRRRQAKAAKKGGQPYPAQPNPAQPNPAQAQQPPAPPQAQQAPAATTPPPAAQPEPTPATDAPPARDPHEPKGPTP